MNKELNRRDFLKLSSLLPFATYVPPSSQPQTANNAQPNILIFVFDAFSGRNTPFAGYPRNTLPKISRLAEKATVYHNHFASSNFTTPGTASLLTGTYPWSHRAMKPHHPVIKTFTDKNIFSLFDHYHRISYTHNPLASVFLDQFNDAINLLKPREELTFGLNKGVIDFFSNDKEAALLSWLRNFDISESGTTYSLILRKLYEYIGQRQSKDFPRGVPHAEGQVNFYLEDAIDWTISTLQEAPQPFLGYFHYFPPHDPYHTRADFIDAFKNTPVPFLNKSDRFARYFNVTHTQIPQMLKRGRREYDEFILYVDEEFNRLFTSLQQTGLLDNTWVIFTSDHGELFERQKHEHMLPLLYNPLVNIPLLVFAPGQQARQDIHTATSATDILPSLLHLAGKSAPDWAEGQILPQFSTSTDNQSRSVFALDAREIEEEAPITRYTGMIVKGSYKLQAYHNYEKMADLDRHYELFNYVEDPEELEDLSEAQPEIAAELLEELRQKLDEADAPYQNKND